MIRFIACDDTEEALDKAAKAIQRVMMSYDFDYKISKFTKYDEELHNLIKSKSEQKVYILDVQMPKVSGLEIASEIRDSGDWDSMIIFVSAHPECKDDIFFSRLMALDFISKFFDYKERLEKSLLKVLEIYDKKTVLIFTFDYTTYRVPINKILYIEKVTDEHKCIIATENGKKYEVTSTLKDLANKLNDNFYQTHKKCIVNVKNIDEVDYITNTITFDNKMQTKLLSDRNRKGLKAYLETH